MSQKDINHVEDEIVLSPKKIIRALHDRKLIINLCILLFLIIGSVKLYFSEPQYEARASIIIKNQNSEKTKNTIDEAFGITGVGDLKTEMEIIRSRKLIGEAIKLVSFDVRYIADGLLKKREIHRGRTPFTITKYTVHDKRAYNKLFKIQILDNSFYQIETEESLFSKLGLSGESHFKGIYKLGESARTPFMTLTVNKTNSQNIFYSNSYYFSINPDMYSVIEKIYSKLRVEQAAKEASVINIAYQDTSPERAKEVVTSLAQSSIEHNIDSKTAQATATLDFIKNQMNTIKSNLEKSEKELESFKKVNNFMDIGVETEVTARKLSSFDQQLAQMEIEEHQINRLTEAMKKGDFGYLSAETVFPTITDPLITKLLKNLNEAETKKSALLAEYTEKHPEVLQITSQIKKLKSDIRGNIENLKSGIHERKESMEKIISKNEDMFRDLPQKEREYINLKREYLVNEKIYSYLLEKESEASILKASTVSSNSVLDNAVASNIPISPNVNQTLFMFIFFGFSIGSIISLSIYFITGAIEDKQDILKIINAKTIYLIPFVKKTSGLNFCNAFRNIRSHIIHMGDQKGSKCICISSSFANNGKTTCIANIGSSLAFAGHKTVIVDLDFKESKLGREIQIPLGSHPGVSNYFELNIEAKELAIQSADENLFIVTTGSGEHKRTKYLSPKKIFELIEELKKEFDFVLLNCPNTSITIDAFEYAKYADFSLFVLMAYSTKKRSLEKISANLKLFDVDTSKVGVILNGIKRGDYGDGLGCETVDKLKSKAKILSVLSKF